MTDVTDGADAGVAGGGRAKQEWVEPQLEVVPLADAMKTAGAAIDNSFQYS